jgi:hypothetical protein
MRRPIVLVSALLLAACSAGTEPVVTLKTYPITEPLDVLTRDVTQIDTAVSSDGNGSLRVHVEGPTTIRLYETGDLDVEDARITYAAKLRTEGVAGTVYLEMWCVLTGQGESFSRALHAPLTGTTDWTSQETPFFLQKGQNPDNMKLNLVIDGSGTVWIDDIRLLKGPLRGA